MNLLLRSINITLTLLFLVAAAFLIFVAVPYFGNKALIVRSGSMSPAIAVGDLVVVRAANRIITPAPGIFPKYKVGDVVAFSGEKDAKTIITHRVVNVDVKDGKIAYTTKGDANNAPDASLASEDKILGKTTLKIPSLGKIFALAKTKNGFLALVVLPAILVIIFEIINIIREVGKIRQKKITNNILLRLLVPLVIGTMFFQGSFANYADTETSGGNLFQAAENFGNQAAQTLVINEVLSDSSCFQGQTEAQWLEVYNGFSTIVNLKNFKITDGSNTIDLVNANNIDVAPGGFVLLAHSTAIFGDGKCYQDNGTQVANLGGQLDIDTEFLQLLDSSDNVIDTVQWAEATGLNPSQNESIERDPDGLDSAAGVNFNASDFVVRSTPQPGL